MNGEFVDLLGYLKAIRKSWWLVVTLAIVGGGLGGLMAFRAAPDYQSNLTFFVSTPSEGTGTAVQADQYAQRRINSYALMLNSERLAELIIAKTGITLSVAQVQAAITPEADPASVVLNVSVVDTSPTRSLAIATALSTQFNGFVAELDNRGSAKSPNVQLTVTSGPTLATAPVSPRKSLYVGFGLLVGLGLGLVLAVLRELLNTTVRTSDALRSLTGIPVLGSVPYDLSARRSPLIVHGTYSLRSEAYRQVRTALQFSDVDRLAKVIQVTSATANEGKSTTAINLAIVFSENGERVLLIEADLRRPRVANYLGLEGAVGMTNVLVRQVELADVLQPWGSDGLTMLASGSIPPNPSELLGSTEMSRIVTELRGQFDRIVIDTPPLLPVTDGAVVSASVDGVVLVVRHGKTTRTQVQSALRILGSVDARVLGCVLNMTPVKGVDASDNYDVYGSYDKQLGESLLFPPPPDSKADRHEAE